VRIGNSVVQFTTSSVAKGISYAEKLCADEATPVHVMSMSMGGVAPLQSHHSPGTNTSTLFAGMIIVAEYGIASVKAPALQTPDRDGQIQVPAAPVVNNRSLRWP